MLAITSNPLSSLDKGMAAAGREPINDNQAAARNSAVWRVARVGIVNNVKVKW